MNATNHDIDTEGLEAVIDWIVGGAASVNQPQDVLAELCTRLTACGVPLWRVAVFVRTLHPNIIGRRFVWRPGQDVEIGEAPYSILEDANFLDNPIPKVIQSGEPIRRRIGDAKSPRDFQILDELAEEGVTDYFVQPLKFTNGEVHAVSWTTLEASGFSHLHMAALNRIGPAFARLAEVYAFRRTARTILNTYLSRNNGDRVLHGLIKRGGGEDIHAVIWFCDLRGSTPLADALTREDFLAVLNQFFECTAGAVLDHGGEVLRFIGDAVLAIFPIGVPGGNGGETSAPEVTTEDACATALGAAKDAIHRMEILNDERRSRNEPPLGLGIRLHLGDVMYGNIGVAERLEFTVIGAAANEAARIEALCKEVGKSLVISAEVARHLPDELQSLGHHKLRGVGAEVKKSSPPPTPPIEPAEGVDSTASRFSSGGSTRIPR